MEKQNLLFASGDYPAVFMAGYFTQSDQMRLGASGLLIPLNGLIEEYADNIKAAFAESPYVENMATALDGNIYALPGIEECVHCFTSQKIYLNVKWLEKLGLSMPETTEDLYEVLTAFRDNDPNGNGIKDEIPLTAGVGGWNANPIFMLMCSFINATEGQPLSVNKGVVDIAANKPEWREGLRYVKRLYSEGLLDSESFTHDWDSMAGIADNPDIVIMGGIINGCCIPSPDDTNRFAEYEVVPPLKGPTGYRSTGATPFLGDHCKFAITKKATEEQKVAAIRIVDYFYSQEGAISSMYGPKGIGWVDADPGSLGSDGKPAIYKSTEPSQREDKRPVNWETDLKYMNAVTFNGRQQEQDITIFAGYETYLAKMNERIIDFVPDEVFPDVVWFPQEEAQRLAQFKTDIVNHILINSAQFVVGGLDIDNDSQWNAYVTGFDGLGLAEFLAANQKAYDSLPK